MLRENFYLRMCSYCWYDRPIGQVKPILIRNWTIILQKTVLGHCATSFDSTNQKHGKDEPKNLKEENLKFTIIIISALNIYSWTCFNGESSRRNRQSPPPQTFRPNIHLYQRSYRPQLCFTLIWQVYVITHKLAKSLIVTFS